MVEIWGDMVKHKGKVTKLFHSKKHHFVSYISLFYRVRGLRKGRAEIEGVAPLGKEELWTVIATRRDAVMPSLSPRR